MAAPIPILPAGAVIGLKFWFKVITASVEPTLQNLVEFTEKKFRAFWYAFPNPVKMLDVAVSFMTGWVGILLQFPFNGVEVLFLGYLKEYKLGSKVMTVENAIKGFFACQRELFSVVTNTNENGLVIWLLQWLGRTIWAKFKSFKFLLALLNVKTEEEFVLLIINKWKKRALFLRAFYTVIYVLVTVVWAAFLVSALGLLINFSVFWGFTFPQDSKRVWRRGFQHRVNERTGPDKPVPVNA